MAQKKVARAQSRSTTEGKSTQTPLGPRVVHRGEAEQLVEGLDQVLENLLDLAEVAAEHPYNEIVLEGLLKVRQMRGVLQTELKNYATGGGVS